MKKPGPKADPNKPRMVPGSIAMAPEDWKQAYAAAALGGFRSVSEYIRNLVRNDKKEKI